MKTATGKPMKGVIVSAVPSQTAELAAEKQSAPTENKEHATSFPSQGTVLRLRITTVTAPPIRRKPIFVFVSRENRKTVTSTRARMAKVSVWPVKSNVS
jgi:hypothetical protein